MRSADDVHRVPFKGRFHADHHDRIRCRARSGCIQDRRRCGCTRPPVSAWLLRPRYTNATFGTASVQRITLLGSVVWSAHDAEPVAMVSKFRYVGGGSEQVPFACNLPRAGLLDNVIAQQQRPGGPHAAAIRRSIEISSTGIPVVDRKSVFAGGRAVCRR